MADVQNTNPIRYRLHRFEVVGLWGHRKIIIKFNSDVNFLIGSNGCGKTTIINMISAVISTNFNDLVDIRFQTIKIFFSTPKLKAIPMIRVDQTRDEKAELESLRIRYYDRSTQVEPDIEDILLYGNRRSQLGGLSLLPNLMGSESGLDAPDPKLISKIQSLCSTFMLSIHRTDPYDSTQSETAPQKSYDSTVDKRIGNIRTRFLGFCSEIDTAVSAETKDFEKSLFKSLTVDAVNIDFTDDKISKDQLPIYHDTLHSVFLELSVVI